MSKQDLYTDILEITGITSPTKLNRLKECLDEYSIKKHIKGISFKVAYNTYIKAKDASSISKKTLGNYEVVLNIFKKYIKSKSPAFITTENIEEWLMYLGNERCLKKTSIDQYLTVVKGFFAFLYAGEYIPSDPAHNIRINIRGSEKRNLRSPISDKDLSAIRKACKNVQEKALIEFFVSTGCRLGEVVGIDWDNIDFEKRCVEVIGKGNKKRVVFFSKLAAEYMKSYHKIAINKEALFSSTRAPYNRLSGPSIEHIIRNIGKRAGLKYNLHPHLFRHTFATNALKRGVHIEVLSELLGHESVATTQCYIKIASEDKEKQYRDAFA